MNPSYKHLDAKLRIAELTVGQWVGVVVGVVLGVGWGLYVSPFGPSITLTTSVYLAGLPFGAALAANAAEIDAFLLIRSAISWRRLRSHLAPGPGSSAGGYVISEDPRGASTRGRVHREAGSDLPYLWEESE